MSRPSLLNHQLPRSPSLHSTNIAPNTLSATHNPLKRPRSPTTLDDASLASSHSNGPELSPSEARKRSLLRDLYARSERIISRLFVDGQTPLSLNESSVQPTSDPTNLTKDDKQATTTTTLKRSARAIDEDDYGDDDEDEDEQPTADQSIPHTPSKRAKLESDTPLDGLASTSKLQSSRRVDASTADQSKTSEEVRKRLEQEKKAAEDAAKESFQNLFYTLENDRDAMLEQQKLDELDRHLETEMSAQGGGTDASGNTSGSMPQQGTLSSANLGASSLTLKHLIARIDEKRNIVKASDAQIKTLLNEVRKNRSKWASEDKIGQEELYEAAEKVLMELKAKAEWAAPFLQKVNKRDAPDYYHIIKHPMDLGTMIKKLKSLQYNSKKQFCDDLELIWANCLKYNANPEHFLRKKAEHMRKETARLIPLIPDIVVRDRAEVEAEERRLQHDFDDGEDSEDEPLMSTRGRKAPGKSAKKGGGAAPRKAPQKTEESNSTPGPESKPAIAPNNALSLLKSEHLRSDIESQDGSQHGMSTPPPGTMTPVVGSAAPPSHADMSEIEGLGASAGGTHSAPAEEAYLEDEEFQTWKQVTQKDRARIATERHRLFQGTHINPEENALLRTKAAMRRWLKLQKPKDDQQSPANEAEDQEKKSPEEDERPSGTTLAEGMDVEDDSVLPDYYDPLAAVPQVDDRLAWVEDADGQVVDQKTECLRLVPKGQFTAPQSLFNSKLESNMRQIQDTRKLVAKIAVVKQMQLQAQTYQNQFQKYDPEPFLEADVEPIAVSNDGPIMSAATNRQALQRSIGKVFFHAGFEDYQPSAIEAITDLTSDFFIELVRTLKVYVETPKVYDEEEAEFSAASAKATLSNSPPDSTRKLKSRFSTEESLIQTLHQFGQDLDTLDSYVSDDLDRLATRLEAQHARTKDYLTELLRPALDPATVGTDGVGAFNDGSEQFVGGDFAEDIDEDFFGFRELGLDQEFGLETLRVPLHLLQSRVHNAYQPAAHAASSADGQLMAEPQPYSPVTLENVESIVGIAQDFFKKRLEANDDDPLVEDDDLPVKQRYPKPRLPPTGKITSPRKRPVREQQMMARKKRRMEIEAEREREREAANAETNTGNGADTTGLDASISTNATAVENANSIGENKKTSTANRDTQNDNANKDLTNGEPTAALNNADTLANGSSLFEDEVKAIVEDTTLAQQDDQALSGLKIDLNPSTKLDPTPNVNGAKIGDPEKRPATPQSATINGDAQAKDESTIDMIEAKEAQAQGTKEKSKSAGGGTEGNLSNGDGETKEKDNDSKEKNDDASNKDEQDSESQDQDQDANGMLSPESVPIAAH